MSTKEEKKVEAAPAAASPPKKKKLLLIVAGLVVLLVAGGGAAAFLVMSGKHGGKAQHAALDKNAEDAQDAEGDGSEEGGDEGGKKKKAPVFFTMEPFVVNLAGDTQRYLQVGMDLKLSKEDYTEKIKQHMPEIRNAVVLLLSSKQADELVTLDGKNRLRTEIRLAVNEPLGIRVSKKRKKPVKDAGDGEEADAPKQDVVLPKKGVTDVLLTSFVIQ
ncbi:MAG: flagellar basal body-associated FliL family protein [Burkholderiales bacterium]